MIKVLTYRNHDGETKLADQVYDEMEFEVEVVKELEAARDSLMREMPEILVLNLSNSTSDAELTEIFEHFSRADLSDVVEIYMMSESTSYKLAARGMRIGAADFFNYPEDIDRFKTVLEQFKQDLSCELDEADSEVRSGHGDLIGESASMQRLYKMIRKVAPSDITVLLAGESGTGKEVVAKTIHDLSHRSHCPYIAVNCGAISKELSESELFGHVKGAFTGAASAHDGFFARAEGGTLFLDEITEMALELQVKLLRVLEVNKYRPVGGEKDFSTDVRIIASTNRDPSVAVDEGVLREDLYYRIAQFPLQIPPLRARGSDVELLATAFLNEQNKLTGLDKKFDEDALEYFRLYSWPGNVRELKNIVARAYILAGDTVTVDDLPSGMLSGDSSGGDFLRLSVGHSLDDIERRAIFATMEHYEGDKPKVAEVLGISLKTLYNRLKKYQLN